jgi:hypothetical protein
MGVSNCDVNCHNLYIYAIEIEHIEKYATLNLALINYVINYIHHTSFVKCFSF